jgi:AraC-like DNA-binding protein
MPTALHYDRNHVKLNAAAPVRVQRYFAQPDVALHDHSFHEIVLINGGTATHVTTEGGEPLHAGMVLILQPESVHGYAETKHLDLTNLYYLAEWFLADVRALRGIEHLFALFFGSALYSRRLVAPIVRLDLTADELNRLRLEVRHLSEGYVTARSLLYLESCFFKILDELARAYGRSCGRDMALQCRPEVMRGMNLIETQVAIRGEFDATATARCAGLSNNRFTVLFHEHTGMTPMEYFQKHRLHHVCRRLLSSLLSIAEIAHEFGYADVAHMNRYFRRYLKTTPGAYRRRFANPILGRADPPDFRPLASG